MRRSAILASLVLAAAPALAAEPPAAAVLLARLAESWSPLRVAITADVTVEAPGKPPVTRRILIRRFGPGRVRLDFLAPERDRGKVLLLEGDKTWLHLPRAGRTIAVSPQQSPLGGVMMDDLFVEELGRYEAVTTELADAYGLQLEPRAGAEGLARVRIFFDKETLLPVRREVFSASGRPLRTILVRETRLLAGTPVPAHLTIEDHLRPGTTVTVAAAAIEPLGPEAERLFDKDALADGSQP